MVVQYFSKMVQEFLSLFQLEAKRLFWLIGITFGLILAFQYFELPYGNTQHTEFSADKIPTVETIRIQAAEPPSESEVFNNVTIINQSNSTGESPLWKVDETRMSEENNTSSRTGFIPEPRRITNISLEFDETDESSTVESIRTLDNGSVIEQARNLGLSDYNNTMDMNLTQEVNISSESATN